MARVYLAEERALGRWVVIKVPTAELAEGVSAERFAREVRVAAGLQHPNVVPVLSAGSLGDLPYYTMPFIDGASLRERIARGALAIPEALSILRDVARALAHAHAHGVVHRDIKPANILLTGGAAVVADFGIAKALERARSPEPSRTRGATLTQLGMAIGTPAYMAPEQAAGDPDVDHRADLYAWGLIAWEALVGRHPFAGKLTPMQLVTAQLTQAPEPLGTARADVPPSLAALVAGCLAKDPEDRPSDAGEILAALDMVAITPAEPTRAATPSSPKKADDRSIVVLPFANLSADPDNEYFSDGLTDELIADLSRVKALKVISRTSAMRFKGSDKSAAQIAGELGVRYVLEGSVRKAVTNLRITARLVDAESDTQRWSDKYAGTLDDVFDVQERVSREIVRALDLALSADEDRQLARRPIADAAAYDCYLRARHELVNASGASIDRAHVALERGLEIVGDNALLRATLAYSRVFKLRTEGRVDEVVFDAASADVHDILQHEPDLAVAHAVLGMVAFERGRLQEAATSFRRAIAADPTDVDSAVWLGTTCIFAGRTDVARTTLTELLRRDPLSPFPSGLLSAVEWMDGNFQEALKPARRCCELAPDSVAWRWHEAYALVLAGRLQDAIADAEWMRSAEPGHPYTAQMLALTQALSGDVEGARESWAPFAAATFDHHLTFHIAEQYAVSGDSDRAIELLASAVARGFHPYRYMANHARLFDSIRGDPRFIALVAEAKRWWEAFTP
jgi:eukaryotic-like serine/threonine-protein kinase